MRPVNFYLIRGLGREAAHWAGFDSLLEQQSYALSVTCLDLPGAGKFNKLSSPLSINEMAEFLLLQIKEEQSPNVIVSISLGSMVAIEMAKLKPQLFSQVFLINTSLSNLSPFYHRLQPKNIKHFFAMKMAKDEKQRELECLKMVSHDSSRWEKLSDEFAEVAQRRPFQTKNLFRQLIAAARYKVDAKKPDVPMVVLNSMNDEMVHPSCSVRLSEFWQLPLFTHPSAGHDISINAPEWLLKVIETNLYVADPSAH